MSKAKKIVLWLLSPYVILVVVIAMFALSARVFPATITAVAGVDPSVDPLAATSTSAIPIGQTILNTIGFLLGALAVILFPVSLVKAILIGMRKPAPVAPAPVVDAQPAPLPPADPPQPL